MWSSTRNVYTSNINMKCVKKLRLIHAAPTSRPHVHNAVLGDTPGNLEAFFDDPMCQCAWCDYPEAEVTLQPLGDGIASLLLNRKQTN